MKATININNIFMIIRLTELPITSDIFACTTGRNNIAANILTKTGSPYKSINSTTGLLSHIENQYD
jgi:hypothetical protein